MILHHRFHTVINLSTSNKSLHALLPEFFHIFHKDISVIFIDDFLANFFNEIGFEFIIIYFKRNFTDFRTTQSIVTNTLESLAFL